MNAVPLHPVARNYLKSLKRVARRLPRDRRNELLEEIEAHLREAIPVGAGETEAREVIERLGEPKQIAAEAALRGEVTRDVMPERIAVLLLLGSGLLLPGLGWIAGFVLLWRSRAWSLRDKLLGTVVPGATHVAVLAVWLIDGVEGVRDVLATFPFVFILAALPILTAVYLWRSASRAVADAY
jgi:hypothetical protein